MAKVSVLVSTKHISPTFEKGQLVVTSKGRVILCSGLTGATTFAGTIVAYTDGREDPPGFVCDEWDKKGATPFQGSITLTEG